MKITLKIATIKLNISFLHQTQHQLPNINEEKQTSHQIFNVGCTLSTPRGLGVRRLFLV
jgi:hypothetical protein